MVGRSAAHIVDTGLESNSVEGQPCSWIMPGRKELFFVSLVAIFLVLLFARPALGKLDEIVLGDDNDAYINPWADWWTLRALTSNEDFWYTRMMFYPQGADLTYHSFSHLNTALSLTLRPLLGSLRAYNTMLLANLALSFVAMYVFGRIVLDSQAAALLAAAIFTFNSQNVYQLAHPVLLSTWCLPASGAALLCAARADCLKERPRAARWAVVAGLITAATAATSTLLLILMGLWFLFCFVWLRSQRDVNGLSPKLWLIVGAVSLVGSLPFLFPLLAQMIRGGSSFIMDPHEALSADPFFTFVPHWWIWHARSLYPGLVTLALVVVALRQRKARPWLLLAGASLFFAIGPYLDFAGHHTEVFLPWSWPLALILRNPYRLNILVALGIAMAAAVAWQGLLAEVPSARKLAATGVIIILFFAETLVAGIPYRPLPVSTFYTQKLEAVPDDVVLATLPSDRGAGKKYLYYQTLHGHPITGGVVSRPTPETFATLEAIPLLTATKPPPNIEGELAQLRSIDVGYLVLDKQLMDVSPWREALTAAPAFEDDLLLVYRVP